MSSSKAYNSVRRDVPHNLRQIRMMRGLTLAELAEKMDSTPQTIQRYETDPKRLRVYQLQQLAEALACSIGDLVAEPGEGLTESEADLVETFRSLSREDQEKWRAAFKAIASSPANDTAA